MPPPDENGPPSTSDGSNTGTDRLRPRTLLLIFLVALLARGGYGAWQMVRSNDPSALNFPDEQQYWEAGRAMARGELLTDELGFHATRMPLFPWFLSLFPAQGGPAWAKVVMWFVGSAAALFTAMLGASAVGPRTGLIAGLLVALDPTMAGVSSLLLTETPFVTVAAALWWLGWPLTQRTSQSKWGRWLALALGCALAVYVRPSATLMVFAWPVLIVLLRRFDLQTILGLACVFAVVIAALLPWGARNLRVTGDWVWLTNRMGISLYDGVHPGATGASDLGDIKAMPEVTGLTESEWNRYFKQKSWEHIQTEPGRILRLAWVKLSRTWSPVLHAEEYRSRLVKLVFAAWSIPFYGLVIAGIVILRRRWDLLAVLLLPAAYVSALHCLFVGSVRYRVGALPALAVLAAVTISVIWQKWNDRRVGLQ
jgi:4-amino-4-deoxy-L-arabinose transferase-like glycosyltransferase